MKISVKEDKNTGGMVFTPDQDNTVDNKLELLKYTTEVQSKDVKEDISSDFVIAKLGEKDKEAIIEMANNAYFTKRLITNISNKATRWYWNNQTKTWILKRISQNEKFIIDKYASNMFASYMIRMKMTAVVNRNVKGNILLRLISGLPEEDSTIAEDTEDTSKRIQTQIKELISKKEAEL